MKFDIVKNRKYFFIRIFVIITLVVCCLAIFSFINIVYVILPFIQFVPLFISPNFFYQKIGTFEFGDEQIIITAGSKIIINLDDIVSIKIFLDDSRHYDKSTKWISRGWIIRLVIEAKDDFINKYRLLIKKDERDKFTSELEKLYARGIRIRERDGLGAKYFLLNGNLTYKEIQTIKEKYNLTW